MSKHPGFTRDIKTIPGPEQSYIESDLPIQMVHEAGRGNTAVLDGMFMHSRI